MQEFGFVKYLENKLKFNTLIDILLKAVLNPPWIVEKLFVFAWQKGMKGVERCRFTMIQTGFPHCYSTFPHLYGQQFWCMILFDKPDIFGIRLDRRS